MLPYHGGERRRKTSWQQAQARTIQQWLDIRAALGRAHPVDLLTEINLICPLCEQAETDRETRDQPDADRCSFCVAYDQFGGCRKVCAEISTKVAERDWEAACELADDFIEQLRGMELPPGG